MIKDLLNKIQEAQEALYNKILSLPENENIDIKGDNHYQINFSQVVGNPLNYEYYSFKRQYEMIVKSLKECKIENFENKLKEIISNKVVVYDRHRYQLHPEVLTYLKELL